MRIRIVAFACLAVALSGCSHNAAVSPGSVLPSLQGISPHVVQTGSQNGWKNFSLNEPYQMVDVVAGHDGNLWANRYVEAAPLALYRISMSGGLTTYNPSVHLYGLVRNPDGNLYAEGVDPQTGSFGIDRITPDGQITTLAPGIGGWAMVSGSDGNLWTYSSTDIVRLKLDGSYTAFSWDINKYSRPRTICRGADKNLWAYATDAQNSAYPSWVRISVVDGSMTAFPMPHLIDYNYTSVICDPSGVFWTNDDRTVPRGFYRFDPNSLTSSFYAVSGALPNYGYGVGADHILYWRNYISVFGWDTVTHLQVSKVSVPTDAKGGSGMYLGPDNQLWAIHTKPSNGTNYVSVLILHPIVPTPATVVVATGSSAPLRVKEQGAPAQTFVAISSDPSIATVSGSGKVFTVTGVAPGGTTITVSDKIGNSLDVPVTVQ